MIRWDTDESTFRIVLCRRQLQARSCKKKKVTFGEVFKWVCLFARNSSEQLKVAGDIYWSGDLMHSAASQVHNFWMSLSIWDSATENLKERKEVSSFGYTPLSWFTAFVVGKLVVVSGGFEWKHISGYSCCISICKQTAHVSWSNYSIPAPISFPTSHLPDHLLARLSSKWSLMNNHHCLFFSD